MHPVLAMALDVLEVVWLVEVLEEVLEVVWLAVALVCHRGTWVAPEELLHSCQHLEVLWLASALEVLWLAMALDVLSHLEVPLQQLEVVPQPDVLLEHLLGLDGSLEHAGTIADVALPRLSANCRGWSH